MRITANLLAAVVHFSIKDALKQKGVKELQQWFLAKVRSYKSQYQERGQQWATARRTHSQVSKVTSCWHFGGAEIKPPSVFADIHRRQLLFFIVEHNQGVNGDMTQMVETIAHRMNGLKATAGNTQKQATLRTRFRKEVIPAVCNTVRKLVLDRTLCPFVGHKQWSHTKADAYSRVSIRLNCRTFDTVVMQTPRQFASIHRDVDLYRIVEFQQNQRWEKTCS